MLIVRLRRQCSWSFSWGFCTHGQLGIKEETLGFREYVEVPARCGDGPPLDSIRPRGAACGHFHTLVVDERGTVFAFGRGDRGQLGNAGDAFGHTGSSATV